MKYKIITILLCLVLLPICWLYLNGLLIPPPLKLGNKSVTYFKTNYGELIGEEYVIKSDSQIFKLIQSELEKSRVWIPSFIPIVPNEILQSDLIKINLTEKSIILSVRENENDNWRQFARDRDQGFSDLFEQVRKYVEANTVKK